MKKPFIQLSSEITREHIAVIANWLHDDAVNRYLSDQPGDALHLDRLLEQVTMTTLPQILGKDGCFLMINDHQNHPIGFVRLIHDGLETEIVIVIGDRQSWGRHYARQAILQSLRIAFFERRSERVVARIHVDNERSLHIFRSLGFQTERKTTELIRMVMTLDHFLCMIHNQPALGKEILISRHDRERLMWLLDRTFDMTNHEVVQTSRLLAAEIDRAIILDSRELPPNVITMNSQATVSIDEVPMTVSLTFSDDAAPAKKSVSVLSPIGTAILGFCVGDQFNWRFPSGLANIQVNDLPYQPEAAGWVPGTILEV